MSGSKIQELIHKYGIVRGLKCKIAKKDRVLYCAGRQPPAGKNMI